jgi:hypothetical protein
MNAPTHLSYAETVIRLVRGFGMAPFAKPFLSDHVDDFVQWAGMPDRVHEVAANVDGAMVTQVGKHDFSSFEHFEVQGAGYEWARDPSLGVLGTLAGDLAKLAGLRLVAYGDLPRPPLGGLTMTTPMQEAAAKYGQAPVAEFIFPRAGIGAAFWVAVARRFALANDAEHWRRAAGYGLHFVEDSCVPHHSWGALLFGHADFENALEAQWRQTIDEVVTAGMLGTTIVPAVRAELADLEHVASPEALCAANADWARRVYGQPHDLAACPGDVALRVSVRAIAASVLACELMA